MSSNTLSASALLLIAHGSRKREANEDLEFLAEELRKRAQYAFVQPAYLELAEPSIIEGGLRCVEQGVRRVVMVPYFLSAGVHARDHLEDTRRELSERFPEVEFLLAEPLGRHPLLVDIVVERAAETCEGPSWKSLREKA